MNAVTRAAVLLAAACIVVYAAACVALFAFQRSMIYFPPPASPETAAKSFTLSVDGAQLRVTTRERPGAQALVYFGGNAEDVSFSLDTMAAAFPERAIYMLHYRSYAGSTGTPSEPALVADALALFDHVRSQHPDIVVVGRSLGSGVAVQMASQRPVSRLVLVTPFDSLQEVAAARFPYFPVRWLMRDKYESWKYAPKVSAPTLLIVAQGDELIPRLRTDALSASFKHGIAKVKVVPAAGHNTVSESPLYVSLLSGGA